MNTDKDLNELLAFDREHVWHPYSNVSHPPAMFHVESANGVYLSLSDGTQLIDGMASWWCVIHGYSHPVINRAIVEQTQQLSHVMFGGLTHTPAIELAQLLIEITPAPLNKIFFSDSGSVSVEVAVKMALQYWQAKQQAKKTRLLSFRNGYHGDTFMAMSLCDPETGMDHLFSDALTQHIFADAPPLGYQRDNDDNELNQYLKNLEALFQQHHNELAAVIIEPIVQGAGGMRIYSPIVLKRLRTLCDNYNVLLILDEIATGFGRTGKLFGCEHANISPDILCLGKSLTGGYMTLAATLCTDDVAATICHDPQQALMHGPTFMGNPLACAVAAASVRLLLSSPWQNRIKQIETILQNTLHTAKTLSYVNDVRILGAIGVIELVEPVDMAIIQPMFVGAGIWVRPFGKLVYIMPPFIISEDELITLCNKMIDVIKSYHA